MKDLTSDALNVYLKMSFAIYYFFTNSIITNVSIILLDFPLVRSPLYNKCVHHSKIVRLIRRSNTSSVEYTAGHRGVTLMDSPTHRPP